MSSDSTGATGTYITAACLSEVGSRRDNNEDAFVIADLTQSEIFTDSTELIDRRVGMDGILLAVADGIGGARAGEVASRMAVEQLADALIAPASKRPISDWLRASLRSVNRYIRSASINNPNFYGMGATITAVVAHETGLIIGQVGDSRAYLIRDGQVQQLTKDQSMVQALIDAGVITPEESEKSPYRHVVLHALGVADDVEPEISAVALARGDHLLLCSDGLSNKVGNVEMHDVVREAETTGAACARLVALANERGGEDNITVVLARFDGERLPSVKTTLDRRIRVERLSTEKPLI
ncbi:MAG TPA: Stp1/IreP family PP2C-type Ser/Thr phosphatase [Blastocatellia bacterium]|jgi:serine/threonine protein phosphatase PrpC